MRSSVIYALLLFFVSSLQAQQRSPTTDTHTAVLMGHVSQDSGDLPTDLTVTVRGLSAGLGVQVPLRGNGSFEFRYSEPGDYEVTITNQRGDVLHQEVVHVGADGASQILPIDIHGQVIKSRAPGKISVKQLLHPIPAKANKEFRLSQKAFKAGDTQNSIEHLEKALRIDPDFMQAHNNLGVRSMALRQYDKAASEFQRAATLDPTSAQIQFNLSLALSALRRYPEAEAAARQAVRLDPHSASGHYSLGKTLALQGKNTLEAVENLRQGVGQYPDAPLLLAGVLARRGAVNEAMAELRKYLRSGNPEKKQIVEDWLARLTQTQAQN